MVNRRGFFGVIAGAAAAMALPFKAAAVPTTSHETAMGSSAGLPGFHLVELDKHYCLDGVGSVTLYTLDEEPTPFYARYDPDDLAPQARYPASPIPIARHTYMMPLDEVFIHKHPEAAVKLMEASIAKWRPLVEEVFASEENQNALCKMLRVGN